MDDVDILELRFHRFLFAKNGGWFSPRGIEPANPVHMYLATGSPRCVAVNRTSPGARMQPTFASALTFATESIGKQMLSGVLHRCRCPASPRLASSDPSQNLTTNADDHRFFPPPVTSCVRDSELPVRSRLRIGIFVIGFL